jgi:hypothetical protein
MELSGHVRRPDPPDLAPGHRRDPRRQRLTTAGRIAAVDDDAHEAQVDAARREIGRLEQRLTSYFTVSQRPATGTPGPGFSR